MISRRFVSYLSVLIELFSFILIIELPFLVNGQACSAETKSDALGPFYYTNSPFTTEIGPENELKQINKRLEVSGRIYSTRGCSISSSLKYYPIENITVEAWYAGTPDNNNNYYYKTNIVDN
jgi:hypothetical protein